MDRFDRMTPHEKANSCRQKYLRCAQQRGTTCEECEDPHSVGCYERFRCAGPEPDCSYRQKGWCEFWLRAMTTPSNWEHMPSLNLYVIDTAREPCNERISTSGLRRLDSV